MGVSVLVMLDVDIGATSQEGEHLTLSDHREQAAF